MHADQWDQMQSLYLEALTLDSTQRDAFLKEATGEDQALYLKVIALLQTDTHPMFQGTAADVFNLAEGEINAGDHIGRYRLVDQIGEGGMGVVYRAERADGAYKQTVALKWVKLGVTSDALLRRFEVERQILAELQHPGIAHLVDGGIHEGRPYLVMEYIDGEPIHAYCKHRGLSIDERIELFSQVCAAVTYAHQNLVVHRDIKSSNILVTETDGGQPRVKLLDFGIARLLEGGALSGYYTKTQTGDRAFTPAYAAPEQIANQRITTATDIYGLGVVLYELLTETLPFEVQGDSFVALGQAILKEEPVAPSQKVARLDGNLASKMRSKRRLSGDLDAILLKALRKEPPLRYASVQELVEDLRRWKENLPVFARQGRTGYRIRKFAQRHRAGIWTAVVMLVVLSTVITIAFTRIVHERNLAQQETAKAEEVGRFLQNIFAIANPTASTGIEVTARELLDRGAARIDEELVNQPEVSAEMALVIGDAYQNLGQYAAADSLLNRALKLQQGLDPENPTGIAKTLHSMGLLKERLGAFDDAIALHQEAIRLIEAQNIEAPALMADLLHGLGHGQMRNRRLDAAERTLERAIALKKGHYGEVHEEVAYSLNVLGDIYQHQERYDAAINMLLETLKQRRAIYGDTHLYVSSTLHNLALALRGAARYDEAERYFRESLAIQQQIPGSEVRDITNTMGALASVLRMDGRFAEAEPLHQDAIRLARVSMDALDYRLAVELARYGFSLHSAGFYQKAETVALEALEIYKANYGTDHTVVAQVATLVGQSIWQQGRYEDAEPMLISGFQTCEAINDLRMVCKGVAKQALAEFYLDWGKPELAEIYTNNRNLE